MLNKDIFNKLVAIRISPSQPPLLGTEEQHTVSVEGTVHIGIGPLSLSTLISTDNAASLILQKVYEDYYEKMIEVVKKDTGVYDVTKYKVAILGIIDSKIEFDNYETDRTLVKLSTTFTITPWR